MTDGYAFLTYPVSLSARNLVPLHVATLFLFVATLSTFYASQTRGSFCWLLEINTTAEAWNLRRARWAGDRIGISSRWFTSMNAARPLWIEVVSFDLTAFTCLMGDLCAPILIARDWLVMIVDRTPAFITSRIWAGIGFNITCELELQSEEARIFI